MISWKVLLCVVSIAAWHEAKSASLPFLRPLDIGGPSPVTDYDSVTGPMELVHVREVMPPALCAGHCASPPAGPVCAFDAAGTARTFATLCELEAVSCRESTYFAITSLGEC